MEEFEKAIKEDLETSKEEGGNKKEGKEKPEEGEKPAPAEEGEANPGNA